MNKAFILQQEEFRYDDYSNYYLEAQLEILAVFSTKEKAQEALSNKTKFYENDGYKTVINSYQDVAIVSQDEYLFEADNYSSVDEKAYEENEEGQYPTFTKIFITELEIDSGL